MKKNLWPSASELAVATPHQRAMWSLATSAPVGILGGNPGAGKSFLTAQAIKATANRHGAASIAVCAPTGKAAQRVNELLLEHGIAGIQATTIHRLLSVSRNGHDGQGWGFLHNASNPLPQRFVYLDESSMAGAPIYMALLAACATGTHVLNVGDFGQLPPVEHGAPLRDMIAAGIPYGELTEIHRNEGDIVRACRDLKELRPFSPSPWIDIPAGLNLLHIEASRPPAACAALASILRSLPAEFNPLWDAQVLCATNPVRQAVNKIVQPILNPAAEKPDGAKFAIGDKVICLTNCVLPVVGCPECGPVLAGAAPTLAWDGRAYICGECGIGWKTSELAGDFVANGEIGQVTSAGKGLMHVRFDSPLRTVRVAGEYLEEFDLAGCITVHRAQGSQWPIVIVMAEDSYGGDMTTSWEHWRTSISRAQKLCITIGRKSVIDRQCKRSALAGRKTFLTELLLKGAA